MKTDRIKSTTKLVTQPGFEKTQKEVQDGFLREHKEMKVRIEDFLRKHKEMKARIEEFEEQMEILGNRGYLNLK